MVRMRHRELKLQQQLPQSSENVADDPGSLVPTAKRKTGDRPKADRKLQMRQAACAADSNTLINEAAEVRNIQDCMPATSQTMRQLIEASNLLKAEYADSKLADHHV